MKVYQAICAITEEFAKSGISKDRENKQQGYSFRGIDDVYGALCVLLAKHKLCILPRLKSYRQADKPTKNGGTQTFTTAEVEYVLVSAEDGSDHVICMVGEGADSGDKSCNKAQSAAYKYAVFQTFCIPVEGVMVDADADSPQESVFVSKKDASKQVRESYSDRIKNAQTKDELTHIGTDLKREEMLTEHDKGVLRDQYGQRLKYIEAHEDSEAA